MKNANYVTMKFYYSVSVWRRILIFQSWKQFYSFATAVAIAVCVVALAASLLTPYFNSQTIVLTLPAGATFAALFIVIGALPATFSIEVEAVQSIAPLIDDIEDRIWQMGYKKEMAAGFSYIPKTPKWLSWNENRISITHNDNVITLCGPKLSLSALRKWLDVSIKGR